MGTDKRFIWSNLVLRNKRNMERSKPFMGREKKVQAAFLPLVLLCDPEGVLQNWNGKTTESGRAKVTRSGGSEWNFCKTSAVIGAAEYEVSQFVIPP